MRCAIILILGFLVLPLPAQAQQAPHFLPNGTAVGGTIGRFSAEGQSLAVGSLQVYGLRERRAGVALSLGVPPAAFGYGLILLPDLGAAYNVSLTGATLLLKGGASALVGIGDGVAGYPGLHLGAALIVQAGNRVGLLIDATQHWYSDGDQTVPVFSIGFGLVGLPRTGR